MKRIIIFCVLLGSLTAAAVAPAAAHIDNGPVYQTNASSDSATPGQSSNSMSRALDPNATVENYRLDNGTLVIRVRLDQSTTIYATEARPNQNGSSEVAVDRWVYLDPGTHTLRFDVFANDSVQATIYSQRGVEQYQRAIQISVGSTDTGVNSSIFTAVDLVVVGAAVAFVFTVALAWQVLRARLGLGRGGERVA